MSAPLFAMACSSIPIQTDERTAEARLAVVPGQNNPPCGASACPTGQVRTCGDVCVTPVAIGYACSQEDCKSDSVCDSHFGASCVPIGNNFLCALPPIGEALLHECDPTEDWCPADLFCKNVGRCFPDSGLPSLCSVGVAEGHVCDSNWDDAYVPGSPPSTSKCRPCMPGTTCLNGHCRKPCTTTDDCPCRDDGDQTTCVSNLAAGAACYVCHSLGEVCNADLKCCDSNTKCGPKGTCCKKPGQACTSQDDCCGGSDDDERCIASTGECGACIGLGQSCAADGDCCSDKCTGGECIPSCKAKEGMPCTVSGAKGECATGSLHCEATGALTCVQQIFSVTEVCNGKDDNCDGTVDNIEPAACQNADKLEGTVCQSGFESSGHTKCVDGKEVCIAEAHKDFCAHCDGTLENSQYCGICAATPCSIDSQCLPNQKCKLDGMIKTCQADASCNNAPPPPCWHPSQKGTCCGSCTP